jgi:hypothetical protein
VRAEAVTDWGTLDEVTRAYATKYGASPFVQPESTDRGLMLAG